MQKLWACLVWVVPCGACGVGRGRERVCGVVKCVERGRRTWFALSPSALGSRVRADAECVRSLVRGREAEQKLLPPRAASASFVIARRRRSTFSASSLCVGTRPAWRSSLSFSFSERWSRWMRSNPARISASRGDERSFRIMRRRFCTGTGQSAPPSCPWCFRATYTPRQHGQVAGIRCSIKCKAHLAMQVKQNELWTHAAVFSSDQSWVRSLMSSVQNTHVLSPDASATSATSA